MNNTLVGALLIRFGKCGFSSKVVKTLSLGYKRYRMGQKLFYRLGQIWSITLSVIFGGHMV